ncbi:MAG: sirohydrochlorin cobaltochelatase [Pseudomonadota bacterium]
MNRLLSRLASHLAVFLLMVCMLMPMSGFAAQDQIIDKSVTILAAFGTSDPDAKKSFEAIEASYAAHGHETIIWSYSSNIIRKKLAAQSNGNAVVYSMQEALAKAHELGANKVLVQSLHVVPAEEFSKIERLIAADVALHPDRFDSIILGHPLLESAQDLDDTLDAIMAAVPADRTPQDAVVFMGHGNDRGPGDLVLRATADAIHAHDANAYLATVEGALGFEEHVLPALKASGVSHVYLMPFMIVAGDHAKNDMAGPEEDSWSSLIKAEGIEVTSILEGMGLNQGIQAIFLRHSADAADDFVTGSKTK